MTSNPDHTSYYHCWAGCCKCATATAVQFFKVTELLCLAGNKSDSSGKYYSSPVPPSYTAVNNMPCTFIGLYSSHTRTVVRECCKVDEASHTHTFNKSNGETQNLTPRHAQAPLAMVIQIGTRDYVVDPYTCATVRNDPPRRFVSAHA